MNYIERTIASAALVAALLMTATAVAQEDDGAVLTGPAIQGYSPVSYFTENRAERGSPEFSVEYDGQLFYLTSREQVALFNENPGKYKPLHRACPYSLAYGMVLPLDPTNFKIVDGNLLLFHRSEEKDALLEWNSSELSEEELLRRAEANAFLVTF